MTIQSIRRPATLLIAALLVAPVAVRAQLQVVDMIPAAMSDETRNNSEPYITVNPSDPDLIATTAFMATPAASPNGPLFVSTNGGATWVARNIIPSSPGAFFNTGDITLRFNSEGSALYAGILRVGAPGGMQVVRTTDMTLTTPMTAVYSPGSTDQPYLFARTVTGWFDPGRDRVWVGNNEGASNPTSATIDQSLDARTGAAPPFTDHQIDAGAVVGRDNYQVRTVTHPDGHVYTAFYRRKGGIAGGYDADVVVVRDDNWGNNAAPHQSLVDTVTMLSGQNVVVNTPVSDTFGDSQALGKDWWGGDLYLTVDPNHSERVYISYSDSQAGAARTLHLRRSLDSGQTWSTDLLTIQSAKNAAIAINSQGRIGYLYQELVSAPDLRWRTRLRRSDDGVAWTNVLLADHPATGVNSPTGQRVLGDYLNMVAVGKSFFGVFSAYNDLVNASFPQGVTFLRNRTAPGDPMPRFLGVDGVTTVTPSVDPFFFSTTEIAPAQDLYVRDWTDSAATHDHGQEPSIRNNFYSRSDVWNRRSNNPQPFDANDRPQPQDPRPAAMGPNWAFTRVSRETSGAPVDVSLQFLFSDGGVGVPYVSAGPPVMLHLDAGDLEKSLGAGSGYQWNLPSGASNHVCLAVEISTAADPIIPPGLLGHAPGWPTTDLLVVADNNKAQRNMQVFGYGGMGAGGQTITAYALVGNAADRVRNVTIGLDVDPKRLREVEWATVRLLGGPFTGEWDKRQIRRVEPLGLVELPEMKPGETRWLELALTPTPEAREPMEVTIHELVDGQPVNGYAFVISPMRLERAIEEALFQQAAVFVRLAKAFDVPDAEDLARRAQELLKLQRWDAETYLRFVRITGEETIRATKRLIEAEGGLGDPFDTVEAAAALAEGDRDPVAAQVRHLSLLNKLDALMTYYQRSKGKVRRDPF